MSDKLINHVNTKDDIYTRKEITKVIHTMESKDITELKGELGELSGWINTELRKTQDRYLTRTDVIDHTRGMTMQDYVSKLGAWLGGGLDASTLSGKHAIVRQALYLLHTKSQSGSLDCKYNLHLPADYLTNPTRDWLSDDFIAVMAFQKDSAKYHNYSVDGSGGKQDGIIGPRTLHALMQACGMSEQQIAYKAYRKYDNDKVGPRNAETNEYREVTYTTDQVAAIVAKNKATQTNSLNLSPEQIKDFTALSKETQNYSILWSMMTGEANDVTKDDANRNRYQKGLDRIYRDARFDKTKLKTLLGQGYGAKLQVYQNEMDKATQSSNIAQMAIIGAKMRKLFAQSLSDILAATKNKSIDFTNFKADARTQDGSCVLKLMATEFNSEMYITSTILGSFDITNMGPQEQFYALLEKGSVEEINQYFSSHQFKLLGKPQNGGFKFPTQMGKSGTENIKFWKDHTMGDYILAKRHEQMDGAGKVEAGYLLTSIITQILKQNESYFRGVKFGKSKDGLFDGNRTIQEFYDNEGWYDEITDNWSKYITSTVVNIALWTPYGRAAGLISRLGAKGLARLGANAARTAEVANAGRMAKMARGIGSMGSRGVNTMSKLGLGAEWASMVTYGQISGEASNLILNGDPSVIGASIGSWEARKQNAVNSFFAANVMRALGVPMVSSRAVNSAKASGQLAAHNTGKGWWNYTPQVRLNASTPLVHKAWFNKAFTTVERDGVHLMVFKPGTRLGIADATMMGTGLLSQNIIFDGEFTPELLINSIVMVGSSKFKRMKVNMHAEDGKVTIKPITDPKRLLPEHAGPDAFGVHPDAHGDGAIPGVKQPGTSKPTDTPDTPVVKPTDTPDTPVVKPTDTPDINPQKLLPQNSGPDGNYQTTKPSPHPDPHGDDLNPNITRPGTSKKIEAPSGKNLADDILTLKRKHAVVKDELIDPRIQLGKKKVLSLIDKKLALESEIADMQGELDHRLKSKMGDPELRGNSKGTGTFSPSEVIDYREQQRSLKSAKDKIELKNQSLKKLQSDIDNQQTKVVDLELLKLKQSQLKKIQEQHELNHKALYDELNILISEALPQARYERNNIGSSSHMTTTQGGQYIDVLSQLGIKFDRLKKVHQEIRKLENEINNVRKSDGLSSYLVDLSKVPKHKPVIEGNGSNSPLDYIVGQNEVFNQKVTIYDQNGNLINKEK